MRKEKSKVENERRNPKQNSSRPVHKSSSQTQTKKKKAQSSKASLILILGVTAVIILIIFASSTMFSPSGNSELSDGEGTSEISDTVSSSKTGFPLSFPAGIDSVAVSDSSIYVASRNTVTCYDLSGSKSKENVLNFASLGVKTSAGYAIVYDRQGTSFALMKAEKIVYEGKTGDGEYINSAFVCDNGNFLIASRSSKAAGMLTYYSKSGEMLFQWLCANEYIVNCAVSENGDNLVCSGISAKSGEMYTTVYYFDTHKTQNNKEYTFDEAVSIDCFFVGNRNVVCVCQDRRILIDFSKEDYTPVEKEYVSTILKQASDKAGNTAVVQKKDDSFDKSFLSVYDSHNNISYECDLPDDIKDICILSSKVYVLTDDAIYKANKTVSKYADLTSVGNCIVAGSRKIYYYTSGVLNRLD